MGAGWKASETTAQSVSARAQAALDWSALQPPPLRKRLTKRTRASMSGRWLTCLAQIVRQVFLRVSTSSVSGCVSWKMPEMCSCIACLFVKIWLHPDISHIRWPFLLTLTGTFNLLAPDAEEAVELSFASWQTKHSKLIVSFSKELLIDLCFCYELVKICVFQEFRRAGVIQ